MTTIIPGLSGLDTLTAWTQLQKDPAKYMDKFSKDPTVQRDINYFNKNIGNVKTVDDLTKDPRLLKVVLDAFDLGSEVTNVGRIKKVLSEDPTSDNSLASKLADPKFKALATALRLDQGTTNLQTLVSNGTIKTNFVREEFESALGAQDPSLREAAYFSRTVNTNGTVGNVYAVLGDSILRDVIQTTFSIPKELAVQPVTSQATALSSRVDFTKFGVTNSSSAGSTAQLSRAKSDFAVLQSSLGDSDKAVSKVNSLLNILNQVTTDYANLPTTTDPAGANATAIAAQQTAVPELIRYNQLLQSGSKASDTITSSLTSLQSLFSQALDPNADLNDLKSQFAAYVSTINDAINNANIIAPDGTTQNLLLNGSNDTISTDISGNGTTVSLNRYDATTLQDSLNTALASFNAITDSSDTNNITAAQGRVYIAQDQADTIATGIAADTTALNQATGLAPTYTLPNSAVIDQGSGSVNDSLDRLNQISNLLVKIGNLVTTSASRSATADRSDLQTSFSNYRDQIESLIDNTGASGLDNFLNGYTSKTYGSISVKSAADLTIKISSILDGADISTPSGTSSLNTSLPALKSSVTTSRQALAPAQVSFDTTLGTTSLRKGLSSVTDSLSRIGQIEDLLKQITDLANQSKVLDVGADRTALTSQFNTAKSKLTSLIQNGGTGLDNFLNNVSNQTYTTSSGASVTVEGGINLVSSITNVLSTSSLSDINSATTLVTTAGQALNAAYGAEDNLLSSQTALTTAFNGVGKTYDTSTTFVAALNTAQLEKGDNSVNDGLNRITQINALLSKINGLATDAASRSDAADHSDLDANFADYKAQIRSLIENTTGTGLDNFLNNAPDTTYEIVNGQNITVKGGYNLDSSVADLLDSANLDDVASATDLQLKIGQAFNRTQDVQNGLSDSKTNLDNTIQIFDPQGRLDNQITQLKAGLDKFIASAAASNGKNLLDPNQPNITLSLSTGTTITLHAQTTFASDLAAGLDNILAQIATGDQNAIQAALNGTLYTVSTAANALSNDNRNGTLELGKLGGTIDTLSPPASSTSTTNPYQVNTFTQKFLVRYLTQYGIQNGTNGAGGGSGSYLLSLFGGSSSSSSSSTDGSASSILSLALSLKV